MSKDIFEKSQIFLKNLLMHWNLWKFVKDQSDVDVELSVYAIRVEKGIHLLNDLSLPLYLNVDLIQYLILLQTKTRIDL